MFPASCENRNQICSFKCGLCGAKSKKNAREEWEEWKKRGRRRTSALNAIASFSLARPLFLRAFFLLSLSSSSLSLSLSLRCSPLLFVRSKQGKAKDQIKASKQR
jgi:hypothetical protein